jgi:hypothetical protein
MTATGAAVGQATADQLVAQNAAAHARAMGAAPPITLAPDGYGYAKSFRGGPSERARAGWYRSAVAESQPSKWTPEQLRRLHELAQRTRERQQKMLARVKRLGLDEPEQPSNQE